MSVRYEGSRPVHRCRVCSSDRLVRWLDLGETPLANSLVDPGRAAEPEPVYPLDMLRCERCGLVQLGLVVAPERMFVSYPYASSASPPLLAHFAELAAVLTGRFVPPGGLVVEIGSNDGVLLRPLRECGARAIGVEPATNLAEVANRAGLETRNSFFDTAVARDIAREKGRAVLIVGTNVFAHIDDLDEALQAIDALLEDRGVFAVEVPYLADLIEHVEYDTIYHEHLSYFSLAPLATLFARGDFELIDAERLAIHGGSIRVFAARRGRWPVSDRLRTLREEEGTSGLHDPATYEGFAERVEASRLALRGLLSDLRGRGARIAAHGASAKGSTLLNFCRIGRESIEFIADSTPYKQGMLSPGMRIPIRSEVALEAERPNYALMLAWNYADAIVARFMAYQSSGGRFIHPIPLARVLEPT